MFFIFSSTIAQEKKENYKRIYQFLVPVELLDPEYPVMQKTSDKEKDLAVFENELHIYTKSLGKFPEYVYTGDVIKDQANYEDAILLFLLEHPYFPQPLLGYDSHKDINNFEMLYKGYFKYFPENAKRIIIIEKGGTK
jgi:hypothetical protein